MKKKNPPFLLLLPLLVLGFTATSCNKEYISDPTGTWGKPEVIYFALIPEAYKNPEGEVKYPELIQKINAKFKDNTFLKEVQLILADYPETLTINQVPEKNYTFVYKSGFSVTGTYEQFGQNLSFKNAATLDIIYGQTPDNATLWLYLVNKSYVDEPKDSFYYGIMNLFDLNAEEAAKFEVHFIGIELSLGYVRIN